MPRPIATVDRYMSSFPSTISPDDTLFEARRKMQEHGIHHLPVMKAERLLGVVSDRDIQILDAFPDIRSKDVQVAAVMTATPYVVLPLTSVDVVVVEMVARRYGSAIVADASRVLGIFTAADALKAFADFLSDRVPTALE